jgi:hypothetical protein
LLEDAREQAFHPATDLRPGLLLQQLVEGRFRNFAEAFQLLARLFPVSEPFGIEGGQQAPEPGRFGGTGRPQLRAQKPDTLRGRLREPPDGPVGTTAV